MIRVSLLGLLLGALVVPALAADEPKPQTSTGRPQRVFELRTYYTNEGKLEDLHKRFREHTNRIFQKHGIELVGYWTPQDETAGKKNKLVYLIAFPSREAAAASWKAFGEDPEWKKVKEESEKNGKIVTRVESIYLDPTDYSPVK